MKAVLVDAIDHLRLADGQLDAFFYAGGTPFAALIQLGSTKGFELYKFSDAERKEINKIIPYYVESMIPAAVASSSGPRANR